MAEIAKKHSAVLSRMLASHLLESGHDAETIFNGSAFDTQLLHEDAPTACLSDSIKFFEQAAVLTGNANVGFQLGKEQDIRDAGLIGYVGLAAPTVGGLLSNFTRYSRVVSEALEIDDTHLYTDGIVDWDYAISPGLARRQYVECSAVCLFNTLRRFSAGEVIPRSVKFQHNRRSKVDEIEAYFGCKVEFGAERNGFEFALSDLELPLTTADEQLLSVLKSYGDQILLGLGRQTPSVIVEVERAIARKLTQGPATLENVAASMGMSARTLSRKLAAEGTTFFRLLENLRETMSKSYLRDSNLMLAEIAFLLGYAGLSSFNEAFKRWTGCSPGQFRTT